MSSIDGYRAEWNWVGNERVTNLTHQPTSQMQLCTSMRDADRERTDLS